MQPQSDGMVKKLNATLETILKVCVDDHHTDWNRHIL